MKTCVTVLVPSWCVIHWLLIEVENVSLDFLYLIIANNSKHKNKQEGMFHVGRLVIFHCL